MGKKVLQCEYCRHLITEEDVKCPNCGANCSNIIKKYKEELAEEERIANEKVEKERTEKEEHAKKTAKAIALGFGITSLVPIILFIVSVVFIFGMVFFFGIREAKNNGTTKEEVSETVVDTKEELEGYTISIDKYEFYEYYDKTFTQCNTKSGYQRIAFYFTIENTGEKSIETYSLIYGIQLKANNEVVSSSSLRADDHFCNVRQGKKDYTKLSGTKLLAKDKLSGYIGYEVPTGAEKLKFIIDEDHIIEMDNPAYKK